MCPCHDQVNLPSMSCIKARSSGRTSQITASPLAGVPGRQRTEADPEVARGAGCTLRAGRHARHAERVDHRPSGAGWLAVDSLQVTLPCPFMRPLIMLPACHWQGSYLPPFNHAQTRSRSRPATFRERQAFCQGLHTMLLVPFMWDLKLWIFRKRHHVLNPSSPDVFCLLIHLL